MTHFSPKANKSKKAKYEAPYDFLRDFLNVLDTDKRDEAQEILENIL